MDECQDAIDKYFGERNEHFRQRPKQAGNKIWGKERVMPTFEKARTAKIQYINKRSHNEFLNSKNNSENILE